MNGRFGSFDDSADGCLLILQLDIDKFCSWTLFLNNNINNINSNSNNSNNSNNIILCSRP